jgi:hypothetical protein
MKRIRSKAKRKGLVEVTDWRELKPGQEVHYNGRSGSYWLNSDGSKDYTTDKGVYKVVTLLDKGFGAYGKKGYTFFDMTTGQSKISSMLYNSPYKIANTFTILYTPLSVVYSFVPSGFNQEVHYNGRSGSYWLNPDGTKEYTTDRGVYRIVNVLAIL